MAGINFDTLTLDEVEELEDVTGKTLDDLMTAKGTTAKVLKGLAYIALRRTKPAATIAQVGKMSLVDIMTLIGGSEVVSAPKATPAKRGTSAKPGPSSRRR